MSLTIAQKTNADGFPKAGELIEITGTAALEASDRAILNLLYQHAHDSGRFTEPDAAFEMPITDLLPSSHLSTDRVRESLARLLDIKVQVPIKHPRTGSPATLMTHLFSSFVVPETAEPGNPATVRFRVPSELLPVLLTSNRWGRIKAATVCAMASKYGPWQGFGPRIHTGTVVTQFATKPASACPRCGRTVRGRTRAGLA